ncbi:hypothetical protein [Citricoccus sp. NR2]|uniref:hypothetical protein n=1 Tax=Citricoccus sp. NR2 TaxID=3004095 RepID=UPI0022DD61C0|nr:hypothetical protein [Citricoccus sp. NR2]WBL18598.1 hypothetical protein O1A05_12665 [Citricoccus sp. NR2]
MDNEDLKKTLREFFDSRIFNYGDYNVVYANTSGSSDPLLIGYRRQPLEMVLCPVPSDTLDPDRPTTETPTWSNTTIELSNVATLADTGSGYQVESVTGYRVWFDVQPKPRIPVTWNTSHDVDDQLQVEQTSDAEDFERFMTLFMDTLDSFYTPSDPSSAQ